MNSLSSNNEENTASLTLLGTVVAATVGIFSLTFFGVGLIIAIPAVVIPVLLVGRYNIETKIERNKAALTNYINKYLNSGINTYTDLVADRFDQQILTASKSLENYLSNVFNELASQLNTNRTDSSEDIQPKLDKIEHLLKELDNLEKDTA